MFNLSAIITHHSSLVTFLNICEHSSLSIFFPHLTRHCPEFLRLLSGGNLQTTILNTRIFRAFQKHYTKPTTFIKTKKNRSRSCSMRKTCTWKDIPTKSWGLSIINTVSCVIYFSIWEYIERWVAGEGFFLHL